MTASQVFVTAVEQLMTMHKEVMTMVTRRQLLLTRELLELEHCSGPYDHIDRMTGYCDHRMLER